MPALMPLPVDSCDPLTYPMVFFLALPYFLALEMLQACFALPCPNPVMSCLSKEFSYHLRMA